MKEKNIFDQLTSGFNTIKDKTGELLEKTEVKGLIKDAKEAAVNAHEKATEFMEKPEVKDFVKNVKVAAENVQEKTGEFLEKPKLKSS